VQKRKERKEREGLGIQRSLGSWRLLSTRQKESFEGEAGSIQFSGREERKMGRDPPNPAGKTSSKRCQRLRYTILMDPQKNGLITRRENKILYGR